MSELRVTKLPDYAKEIGVKLPLRNSVGGLLRMHERYIVAFLEPTWLRCFKGPGKTRQVVTLVFFQDAFGTYFYKSPNRSIGYSFEHLWKRVMSIVDLEGNIVYHQQHSLEYIDDTNMDNPMVKCPVCGHIGRLMNSFSLLAAGFNGIKAGDPDAVNLQECGTCKVRLNWDYE